MNRDFNFLLNNCTVHIDDDEIEREGAESEMICISRRNSISFALVIISLKNVSVIGRNWFVFFHCWRNYKIKMKRQSYLERSI